MSFALSHQIELTWNPLGTHNRHPISHPYGWAMGCLSWVFWRKSIILQHNLLSSLWCFYSPLLHYPLHNWDFQMPQSCWAVPSIAPIAWNSTIDRIFETLTHHDFIKWKHFPCYWPFVRGIHWSPANFPHKGQWRGALMFSVICAWTNGWVNNRDTCDLRCHCDHYDVNVMIFLV